MKACATSEGTRRYAARFAGKAAAGHFRELTPASGGLTVSSLGIGTYLGQPDPPTDAAYFSAVSASVQAGINLIDTAINYRFQRSERSVGAALAELKTKGYDREEFILCTKAGFLTPDESVPADANEYFYREYIQPGTIGAKDIVAGCHCLTPRFLENQLQRSLRNLGVEAIDVYYLHNPETQLSEISRADFLERVRDAFEFLESAARSGTIQYYGMATWHGFRREPGARDALDLEEILETARELAGDGHRFRFIQLPFNLAMTEALTLGNQKLEGKSVTMAEAAGAAGISLVASAALLQGQVARNLPPFIGEAFGLKSDAHSALQFTRSSPGITAALVGMARLEHVAANAQLVEKSPATVEQFQRLFERGQSA